MTVAETKDTPFLCHVKSPRPKRAADFTGRLIADLTPKRVAGGCCGVNNRKGFHGLGSSVCMCVIMYASFLFGLERGAYVRFA